MERDGKTVPRDQISQQRNPVFLTNVDVYELRRQHQPYLDHVPDNDNNISVETVTDDDVSNDKGGISQGMP